MWKDVTNYFSEEQRHYKDTYLEICEVLDDAIEVSLFSRDSGLYEIYVSYGIMHGIVYEEADKAYQKREEIKKLLENDYKVNKEPTDEFIQNFHDKYKIALPFDLFFDTTGLFGF